MRANTGTPVVLLVDDNINDIDLTLWAFDQNDPRPRVVVAHDGTEALNLLLPADQATSLRPAIVLLDLTICGPGGLEVLKRLRADPGTTSQPVVTLTHLHSGGDVNASYAVGANSCVQKPVTADEFLNLATTFSTYWLRANLLPPITR